MFSFKTQNAPENALPLVKFNEDLVLPVAPILLPENGKEKMNVYNDIFKETIKQSNMKLQGKKNSVVQA